MSIQDLLPAPQALEDRLHPQLHGDYRPYQTRFTTFSPLPSCSGGSTPFTNPALFHTGWFVESLATQTLVVFIIRTAGNPFKSLPSKQLLYAVLFIVALSFFLPYTYFGKMVGFVPLHPLLILAIILLTITYLWLVQVVKVWFYKKNSMM